MTKYSKLFPKTIKQTPQGATLASHKLLYQAGYIRESTAGRYYLLPLAMRVFHKIQRIIKEEMDSAGGQEIITPVLHPKSLWEETNRASSVGFELMSIKDRSDFEFVLGGTAEEMLVDLVRKFQVSYKDLPFNLYQFSTKFRDEMRARGGLLRVREFVMKDAYSFHGTEEDFKKEYKKMEETYTRIFERMGLKTHIVEADNGYIGGEYCHEFVVESEAGESRFLTDEEGYSAHEDVAKFVFENQTTDEKMKLYEEVLGKGIIGAHELAVYLKIPVEKTTKTILFETEKGNVIAAAVRGDFDINEVKLLHAAGCYSLKLASEETVKKVTGAEVGFAGLLNLPEEVKIFVDESCANRTNFEMGANKTDYHSINVNFGRDLPHVKEFYDFKLAKDGYEAPSGKKLIAKKGIEVGNIFQLGLHYSSKMTGAHFIDEKGNPQPYYMGCYGIGLARTLATIVEISNDDKGIIWPESVAPFQVHLVGLDLEDAEIKAKVEEVYKRLEIAGVEVLYDDRNARAGEKFADADLIGIPYRVVVSKKTHSAGSGQAEDKLEVKKRSEKNTEFVSLEDLLKKIRRQLIPKLKSVNLSD